jgi:hypothetical protein
MCRPIDENPGCGNRPTTTFDRHSSNMTDLSDVDVDVDAEGGI